MRTSKREIDQLILYSLNQAPMQQFNETIKIDDEVLSFAFNRIYTKSGEKFFVVVEKDRQFFQFNMQRDNSGKWTIAEPAPEWLKPIEENLANIIAGNL
jgi:hypothetical protein